MPLDADCDGPGFVLLLLKREGHGSVAFRCLLNGRGSKVGRSIMRSILS